MEEQGQLSPSMHVPLRLLLPGYGGTDYSSNNRQLAVVTPPSSSITTLAATSSRFQLPEGWTIQEVPRADATRVDKYYFEPKTGHKFRSLKEVERYINGEVYTPRRRRSRTLRLGYHGCYRKKSSYRKMIVSGGKLLRLDDEDSDPTYRMAIVPATNASLTSPYKLPEGWVVEEVPRPRGNYIDKYYYEPGTGRKFRSLLAVERYLAELKENTSLSNTTLSEAIAELKEYNTPLSKVFKIGSHVKNSSPWKPNIPREKVQTSTFNSPPMKINWVIAGPGGDSWNPFIGGTLVPESVKQQWSKRFMLSINNGSCDGPNF